MKRKIMKDFVNLTDHQSKMYFDSLGVNKKVHITVKDGKNLSGHVSEVNSEFLLIGTIPANGTNTNLRRLEFNEISKLYLGKQKVKFNIN